MFIVNLCITKLKIVLDLCDDSYHVASIQFKTTIIGLTMMTKVLVAYSTVLDNWFLFVFNLYTTSFLTVYLIKFTILAKLKYVIVKSNMRSNRKLLANYLSTIKSLHSTFESLFSIFAFYLFLCKLIEVIDLFYAIIVIQSSKIGINQFILYTIISEVKNLVCVALIMIANFIQEEILTKWQNFESLFLYSFQKNDPSTKISWFSLQTN